MVGWRGRTDPTTHAEMRNRGEEVGDVGARLRVFVGASLHVACRSAFFAGWHGRLARPCLRADRYPEADVLSLCGFV